MLTNNLHWSEGESSCFNGRIIRPWCIMAKQHMNQAGNREWISMGTGLLPQPSACLPSFITMIYSCSLCPDLIFQTHVRCGSLGKALTINKQTLFTWLIFQEAMMLKHLEQRIYLFHTSKYHPDAIDIYWAMEKTAGVERLHHVRWCLSREGMERRSDERDEGRRGREEGSEFKRGWESNKKKKTMCSFVWLNQSKTQNKTEISVADKYTGIKVCLR